MVPDHSRIVETIVLMSLQRGTLWSYYQQTCNGKELRAQNYLFSLSNRFVIAPGVSKPHANCQSCLEEGEVEQLLQESAIRVC